ncbi:uncharacterized protein LOC109720627 isoform X1 [Ananas comosus]|uniref:Uncharacterized protein LOC109720627 isoform X1 n=1 Tax=Ananas comosus TaxID=4615 RepID=A0A6P5G573_ANACO|nr:uncharacterized protein LOC109720627 isoform X1 [Ananas comosus]
MEKYFGNAYRGDPGVPHTDPERFVNIWIGSFAFSALTWFNPYMWQLSNQFNIMQVIHHQHFGFERLQNLEDFAKNVRILQSAANFMLTEKFASGVGKKGKKKFFAFSDPQKRVLHPCTSYIVEILCSILHVLSQGNLITLLPSTVL